MDVCSISEGVNKVVVAGHEALDLPAYQSRLKKIRDLSGMPSAHVDTFFLAPLQRFVSMVPHCEESQVLTQLDGVVSAMKCRRSMMLPAGGEAESINAQKDIWTFAVFSAALVYRVDELISYKVLATDGNTSAPRKWCPIDSPLASGAMILAHERVPASRPINVLFLSRIVGNPGLLWLYRDVTVFNAVVDTVSSPRSETAFAQMIHHAHAQSKTRARETTPRIAPESGAESASTNTCVVASEQACDQTPESQNADPITPAVAANTTIAVNAATHEPETLPPFGTWLRGQISQIESTHWLCQSVHGYGLSDPGLFMAYAKGSGDDWQKVRADFLGEVGKLQRLPKMNFKKIGVKSALILPFDHEFLRA